MGIETEKFVSDVDDNFICSICTLVLENPIRIADCEHMFCRLCIDKWMKQDATCPVDRKFIQVNDLIAPDRTVVNMLNKLKIKCEFELLGCVDVAKLENLKSHVKECDFNPENKCACVGCGKIVIKREENIHKCVEKLEIEIKKLKQGNKKLMKYQLKNEKQEETNQKLRQEIDKQNNFIKEMVDENDENQKKYQILVNENEALRLSFSTSTSTAPQKNILPFTNTFMFNPTPSTSFQTAFSPESFLLNQFATNFNFAKNLITQLQSFPSTSYNTGVCRLDQNKLETKIDCSLDQHLQESVTRSSLDKWLLLSRLPSKLKSRVRLAAVLGTGIISDAMIITEKDEVFWIEGNDQNDGQPIKIDGLSGLKIKALEYGSGIGPTFYVMAITGNGELYAWSYSGHPLGTTKMGVTKHSLIPTLVNNFKYQNVVQVACADRHVLALTINNRIYAWGDNNLGQLRTNSKSYWEQPIRVKVASDSQAIAVACCSSSSFAILKNGSVHSWGENTFGQLGLGNNTNQIVPTKIVTLTSFKVCRLACGQNHVLAVTDDGTMFAWGSNCNGQLGTGDTQDKNIPIKIGPSDVKFIEVAACNSLNNLSVAFSEDGRCWVWGQCKTKFMPMCKNILFPEPVESTSINDAIAEYAIYQMTWKTMAIRQ